VTDNSGGVQIFNGNKNDMSLGGWSFFPYDMAMYFQIGTECDKDENMGVGVVRPQQY